MELVGSWGPHTGQGVSWAPTSKQGVAALALTLQVRASWAMAVTTHGRGSSPYTWLSCFGSAAPATLDQPEPRALLVSGCGVGGCEPASEERLAPVAPAAACADCADCRKPEPPPCLLTVRAGVRARARVRVRVRVWVRVRVRARARARVGLGLGSG